nr:DDE-type integrase/transposase/recombinase [uncultured Oscillibacter sp.]
MRSFVCNVLHFCVIIDLFSRKVIGYRVSQKCCTQLVSATFRKAFQDRGNPSDLTFHSDRGSKYISGSFCALLRKCKVKQSFSKSGCPHDNAVVEAFFLTFKREEAYRHEYFSEAAFRKSVDAYVDFYNHVRPHQSSNLGIQDSGEI